MNTNLTAARCDCGHFKRYLDASLDESAAGVFDDPLSSCPVAFGNPVARLQANSADDRSPSATEVQRMLNDCIVHLAQPEQQLPKELMMCPKPLHHRIWWLAIPIAISVALFFGPMFPQSPIASDNTKESPQSNHFLRRTATDRQVRVMGESAANQQLALRIEASKNNKELAWKSSTQEGTFTAIITRTSVPTGPGTSVPGFTFELVNDESGGGSKANIACSQIDPLPNAIFHVDLVKPQERELRGQSQSSPLRIATLKYPDGTEAAVTLSIQDVDKQVATVLGTPIYEGDMKPHLSDKDNFHRLLIAPLTEHYCRQRGIDRAKELEERIKDPPSRLAAQMFVTRWELQRHLYKKYDGRVVLSAFGPVSVDGYRKWIEERKQVGDYAITDPELQTKFDAFMKGEEGERYASPDQIKAAFDPANTERFIDSFEKIPVGAYSDSNYKLIGTVLGNPVHLHQRYFENKLELPELIKTLFVTPLEKHYQQSHPELEPTEAEIDGLSVFTRRNTVSAIKVYQRRLASVNEKLLQAENGSTLHGNLSTERSVVEDKLKRMQGDDGRALAMLGARPFKFQKHLFDSYGGGRVLLRPTLIAFDAQRKWVEERERLGEFQIADAEMRRNFYDIWKNGALLHGNNLIDDPNQTKAAFERSWLAGSTVTDTVLAPGDEAGK